MSPPELAADLDELTASELLANGRALQRRAREERRARRRILPIHPVETAAHSETARALPLAQFVFLLWLGALAYHFGWRIGTVSMLAIASVPVRAMLERWAARQ